MSNSTINPNQIRHCKMPMVPPRELAADVNPRRAGLIRAIGSKWVNGTQLTYGFLQNTTDAEKNVVRNAFNTWQSLCGLTFQESTDARQAMVRITFDRNDGSWSYVGRDILNTAIVGQGQPTMNFGWNLTENSYGVTTALHEIGHTLGFHHEHQNPFSGIVWNEQAVYSHFSGPPNHWSRELIDWNILRKLKQNEVDGSQWDKNSIMHYAFEAGLINKPEVYKTAALLPPGTISTIDKDLVQKFYPTTRSEPQPLRLLQSQTLSLAPGEQKDFNFSPDYSRSYTIQTFGTSDVIMVMHVQDNGQWRYLTADDDSGVDRNAKIQRRLLKGRTYQIRVRLYYSDRAGETAIMVS
ncbi:MAG: matrixin family metalloprotease [Magnetococcales bacterium]|nr:matrixin family metalloprotease [Magnetococcales bacterium]